MALWRSLTRGLHALTHRTAVDRDLTDEVAHYFEQAEAEMEANGFSPEDARRAARLQLGSMTVVKEQVRSYGWENTVETLLADVRYAARRLRRSPGFTAVSVLTLALGIGASTAIFSAVNPILFQPLPYPQAARIVTIWDGAGPDSQLEVTFGTCRELAERNRSFEALAVMKAWQPTLTGASTPERLDGQRISAAYLHALGVAPLLGRNFEESDDRVRGPRVVILGDTLWRRRFAADPAIVGRQIMLDDDGYMVVGVMPATFENVLAPSAEIWAPLQYDRALPLDGREWGHHLRMVGRLRPGVDITAARTELDSIARHPVSEFSRPSWSSLSRGLVVRSLQEDVTRGVRPALVAVMGAVVLLLAIACANVTNLLLARGARRRGEFAMRAALGASRPRLIRQLLTESLLLSALGGTLGMAVAGTGIRTLMALSPAQLPRANAIAVDATVFAFALGITTAVGLAIGLIPAFHASRGDLHAGLHQSGGRAPGGHGVTRRSLVVTEVALAVVLLVCAGLLLRSLQRLFAIDPGFESDGVLTMQVQTSGHRFDRASTHRFFGEALEAVRRVPGVSAAAFTSQLPLGGEYSEYGVFLESNPVGRGDAGNPAFRYAVSPGYIEAMGIPLRRGRLLDAHDTAAGAPAVLISESFATKFARADPLGQRVHIGQNDRPPWYTVVGIVGDVRQTSLALSRPDAVYMTNQQWAFVDRVLWLVVRAQGDPAALTPAVKEAIWSVDKDQPIVRIATMEQRLAASAAERRFALIVFEFFAMVALALAATGIYGLLSGGVNERMREMGVRTALGASRADLLTLVLREGLTLTGLGVALGLAGAAAASGLLLTLLFEVPRLDPVTHVGAVALLLGVAAMSCWMPAWRAARVDPSIALRVD